MGTTIFRNIQAQDMDAGVNGLVEYVLVEGSQNLTDKAPDTLTAADGYGIFAISYPHQGQVSNTFYYFTSLLQCAVHIFVYIKTSVVVTFDPQSS